MMSRALRSSLLGAVLAFSAPPLLAQPPQPLLAGENGVAVPKKTKHVQPVYPAEALAQGLRGIVILDLVVDTSGHVASATIVRSVPGLDEAAVAAARQWEFEPVKVAGKPVSVRLTQAITFALALPRIERQAGIPELRQGVLPSFPKDAAAHGTAAAEVSLEADGRIGAARIVEGSEPWAGALLQALQTWRFSPPPEDATLSFRVEAEFDRGRPADSRVTLRATGLQRADLLASGAGGSAEPTQPTSVPPSSPAPSSPATPPTTAAPAGPATATPAAPATAAPTTPEQPQASPPAPPAAAPPSGEPASAEAHTSDKGEHPATPPVGAPVAPGSVPDTPPPPGTPPPGAPGPGVSGPTPLPAPPVAPPPTASPAAPPSAPAAARAPADRTAPPPVEVITAPPPQQPPENGVSAIRDVTLDPGVPDLTRGRRPVSPPLARIAGATGTVQVAFSVSAAGTTLVQSVSGPELLKKAAEQAVASWIFRRTRADRAYLTAEFSYGEDKAMAVVRPQPTATQGPAASAEPPAVPAQPAAPAAAAAKPPADATAAPAGTAAPAAGGPATAPPARPPVTATPPTAPAPAAPPPGPQQPEPGPEKP
jgi:TonB family protein